MKVKQAILLWICTSAIAASCSKIDPVIPDPVIPEPEIPATLIYAAPENTGFQKIAYFPYYRELDPSSIPDTTLKMIDVACFAFATINSNFTVTLQQAGNLIILAERCKKLGVKVLISFNGEHSIYASMVSKQQSRETFINSIKNIVDTYKLDGVDNDWEYPTKKDNSYQGNVYLMRELSNWLHSPTEGKLLTMAITCGKYVGNISNGITEDVFPCVDWFNVMSYDDFSTSVPGIHHSPFSLLVTAYNYWVGTRQMPKNKFVGGIPIYGRASGITQSGTTLTYKSILEQGGDPDANEATVTSSSYNNGNTSYTIYYNGRPLVREKVDYLITNKTGGYMFWEAGQDMHDDRSIIKTAFDELKASSQGQ